MEEQSIVDYVAERVAPHKKLEQGVGNLLSLCSLPPFSPLPPVILPLLQVMFVESLPKNQTGKLLRRELKAQVGHYHCKAIGLEPISQITL